MIKWGKYVFGAFLVIALTVLIPLCRSEAADASLGSLGSVEGISDELLDRAAEMVGQTDMEAQFEAAYKKTKWKTNFTKADLRYMACIIYCEANGMGFDAKAAVGNVVLNRLNDTREWGHLTNIKEVIWDRGPNGKWGVQFSPTKGNPSPMDKALKIYDSLDSGSWKDWQVRAMNECIEVAKAVFKGYKSVPDTYLYFNGYIDKTTKSALASGWSYRVMEKHIYYNKDWR